MFGKAVLYVLSVFTILATATTTLTVTTPNPIPTSVASCATAPALCCNILHNANDIGIPESLLTLGIVVEPSDVTIGFVCTPITTGCNQHAVCCSYTVGLAAIGCFPITV